MHRFKHRWLASAAALALGLLGLQAPARLGAGPVYVLDHRIALNGDTGWDYAIVDAPAHRLYVSRGQHVDVLDTVSENLVGTIEETWGVHGIALADDLGKGFTSNGLSGTVRVFDLKTLRPGALVPAGSNPDAIVYDPFSHRVFAFNGKSGDATVIDARTEKVLATLPLGCKPEFAAADGAGKVYYNREDKNAVGVIDATALQTGVVWPLKARSPSGLAMDRAGHRLFSVCDGDTMEVVDALSGSVTAEVAIGSHPDAAGYDPGTGLAFASNGDGTLTVVDAAPGHGYAVVDTVATQKGARTMALDPSTHTIYLACAQYLSETAGADAGAHHRPRIKPGTVELLVLKKR